VADPALSTAYSKSLTNQSRKVHQVNSGVVPHRKIFINFMNISSWILTKILSLFVYTLPVKLRKKEESLPARDFIRIHAKNDHIITMLNGVD
jgi:hypothetical protein